MTISIWRYSHLTLAISSSIFILIPAVTGIILAFEPISNQLEPYAINNANQISVAETISSLEKEYDEIVTLSVDDNNFIKTSVITKEGKNETFYVNPFTGEKIINIVEKKPIYKFATNLHRSLFLKSTGRFLVAFFSFLLLLISITGCILITKRQGGFLKLFSKVVKENFNQYYHIVIGRYTLIPIIIITLTGVYLSLEKFSLLPHTKINHNLEFSSTNKAKIAVSDFPIFKEIKLNSVRNIEFPFSEDEEDYFFLKLANKELVVHQYTGEIISNQNLSWTAILLNWSLFLHTGRGTIFWSLVLLLSCLAILFFLFSGFTMTIERKRKNGLSKNKIKKENAEFIILVGSESGNTFNISNALFKAFINENKTVFIDHLNNYTTYKKAKHIIILTSTYGEGEPPINATKFLKLIDKTPQHRQLNYSVVGFGSLAYADFCQFAIDIDTYLQLNPNFKQILPICKINNQAFSDFKNWVLLWNTKTENSLTIKQIINKPIEQQSLTVTNCTNLNIDDTFLISLHSKEQTKFTSGDLLSIIPKEDNIERLYSIGKVDNSILLSIKKHEFGICSNLLLNLKVGDNLQAKIKKNKDFHKPKNNKNLLLIANGTGIAPFLGMLKNNTESTHLFWGGRTQKSFEIYKPFVNNLNTDKLHLTFSQEARKEYIQELVSRKQELVTFTLKNHGTIMICGSINMMNEVLKRIDTIAKNKLNSTLERYLKNGQIKTDCY